MVRCFKVYIFYYSRAAILDMSHRCCHTNNSQGLWVILCFGHFINTELKTSKLYFVQMTQFWYKPQHWLHTVHSNSTSCVGFLLLPGSYESFREQHWPDYIADTGGVWWHFSVTTSAKARSDCIITGLYLIYKYLHPLHAPWHFLLTLSPLFFPTASPSGLFPTAVWKSLPSLIF